MNPDEILAQATDLLQPWIRWTKSTQANTLSVGIYRRNLVTAVKALIDAHWGYLTAITGLHFPVAAQPAEETPAGPPPDEDTQPGTLCDSLVVLYHFASGPVVLTLQVHPPTLEDAQVPSICEIIPSATLYERELMEMFGLQVIGTPNTSRLLLPDDWPDGLYPLRKDFDASRLSTPDQKG